MKPQLENAIRRRKVAYRERVKANARWRTACDAKNRADLNYQRALKDIEAALEAIEDFNAVVCTDYIYYLAEKFGVSFTKREVVTL